jgi:predicted GIY-YIG superfamily endonuclease
MNYRNEKYPDNLYELIDKAKFIADEVHSSLNMPDCPTINDLFLELHKTCGAKPMHSIKRNIKAFEVLNYLPNVKSGKVKSNNEFKGIYVFGLEKDESIEPIYIGISRTVYRRLRQHGFGKLHNQCSLAYLMAKSANNDIERANIHQNYEEELQRNKELVRSFRVVLVPVKKDYELYFLEVALAGILKTKWNSFRTH